MSDKKAEYWATFITTILKDIKSRTWKCRPEIKRERKKNLEKGISFNNRCTLPTVDVMLCQAALGHHA